MKTECTLEYWGHDLTGSWGWPCNGLCLHWWGRSKWPHLSSNPQAFQGWTFPNQSTPKRHPGKPPWPLFWLFGQDGVDRKVVHLPGTSLHHQDGHSFLSWFSLHHHGNIPEAPVWSHPEVRNDCCKVEITGKNLQGFCFGSNLPLWAKPSQPLEAKIWKVLLYQTNSPSSPVPMDRQK